MNERLKEIRSALGLIQAEFGKRLGVTGTAIARIEKGERNLTDQMLLAVCREYNVSEEWLRTGAGDMFRYDPATEVEALAQKYNLSAFDKALVLEYAMLTPEQRKAVTTFMGNIQASLDAEVAAEIAPTPEELSIKHQADLLRARADALEKGLAESTTYEKDA